MFIITPRALTVLVGYDTENEEAVCERSITLSWTDELLVTESGSQGKCKLFIKLDAKALGAEFL